jgi:hypothetical protein
MAWSCRTIPTPGAAQRAWVELKGTIVPSLEPVTLPLMVETSRAAPGKVPAGTVTELKAAREAVTWAVRLSALPSPSRSTPMLYPVLVKSATVPWARGKRASW